MVQANYTSSDHQNFDVVDGLFDSTSLEALRTEAYSLMSQASDHCSMVDEADEWQGGTPARSFRSAPGGAVQKAFFHSPEMLDFLNNWSGFKLEPSGEYGSYSYYTRPGDHLSVHRDIGSCEFVVITCLHSEGMCDKSTGVLCLYPTRVQEPVSAIRENPLQGVIPIHLSTGQTAIMRGGIIPHALSPLDTDQFRIVSILCYKLRILGSGFTFNTHMLEGCQT